MTKSSLKKNRESVVEAAEKTEAYKRIAEKYAVSVSDHVANLIDDENDPVARQYLPSLKELNRSPQDDDDPIGDETHSPVAGIVHRYPDRVLLMPVTACAVYCRFCFRREKVGPGNTQMLHTEELETALDYIRSHNNIWEVILSGGDPLILSPRRLKHIIQALDQIEHVRVIRIHTRLPVADPGRITDDLCAALAVTGKALYISLHINHKKEITDAVRLACKTLRTTGAVLISQTVLLNNVNNDAQVLEDLFRELVAMSVKPYYLHHPDQAPGTSHFSVSVEEGQALVQRLRGHVSGLCIPNYVLDIPGGYGKANIAESAIKYKDDALYLMDYRGRTHTYTPTAKPVSDNKNKGPSDKDQKDKEKSS